MQSTVTLTVSPQWQGAFINGADQTPPDTGAFAVNTNPLHSSVIRTTSHPLAVPETRTKAGGEPIPTTSVIVMSHATLRRPPRGHQELSDKLDKHSEGQAWNKVGRMASRNCCTRWY
jgi:hypothetical protein